MDGAEFELTKQQRRIVDAFRRRADEGLPPPTYRELCREFGWRSTGTARDHMRALVRKKVLCDAGGRSRGAHLQAPRMNGKLLPVVGRIAAGRPVVSEEHIDREIIVPDELVPPGKAFVLRVSGDSMEGVGILDGDLVVVRQLKAARPGNVVAATVDGETTLKTLQQINGRSVLMAANPRYAPIEIGSSAIIHGVIAAVMRNLQGGKHQ